MEKGRNYNKLYRKGRGREDFSMILQGEKFAKTKRRSLGIL